MMDWDSWKRSIEGIGPRVAGPHSVLDTVADGPHPGLPGYASNKTNLYHCEVICQTCGARWPEGGTYPEKCE